MRIVTTIISNKLPKVARQLRGEAERVVTNTLQAGRDNITQGMRASGSPSAPGSYPGVDTGRLVSSITTQQEGLDGMVYTDVEYSAYLEYGTSKMAPRPSFTPASEHMRKVLDSELSELEKRLG